MSNLPVKIFSIIFCAALVFGCKPSKHYKSKFPLPPQYVEANRVYDSTVYAIANTITTQPLQKNIIADSVKYAPFWVGTTNFGLRKPNMVIIHHTAQNSCEQTLNTFTLRRTQVSAHYVICKDGTLHQMLNDYLRAWHAGKGRWGNNDDVNSSSIGIEIDNNGVDTFTNAQINTLLGLLASLKKEYTIPQANFIGHGDIAPTRKVDPNIHFPWKLLADSGYGKWYGDTTAVQVPQGFDTMLGLKVIGYDITNMEATVAAFRRHFLQSSIKGALSPQEIKVLYALMLKFL